jgi:16S rRNA (adenine1518-N6/adenine1519-N6)-dimethyltransferase
MPFLSGGFRAPPKEEEVMGVARKRFGQHFLEPVWADKVVAAIAPTREDIFLEIGPGSGALTLKLAPRVAHLTAVEIDRDQIAALKPRLPSNVTLVAGDILETDLAAVLGPSGAAPSVPVRIAGNLPYNVSSPILFRLLALQSHYPCRDATLMLQREVADRLVAEPGSSEYGVLSVLVQWKAAVTRLLALPPGAFRPPPAVKSALVRLTFRPPDVQVSDPADFERLVRSVFTQRRKTLANALAPFARSTGVSAPEALRRAGIDPGRRPQTLQLVEIARLADVFTSAVR